MTRYFDGFLIPVPKKNLERYRRIALVASKIWMEHGALQYIEGVGDDLDVKGITHLFPKAAKCRAGDTVMFAWIVYKSRKHRDAVNKKVMADPRMSAMMPALRKNPVFDCRRMAYGGFQTMVAKGL